MRHELDPLTRSPQAEQEVDAEVGMLLATQLRELLRGQSLDAYQSRVIPGVLRVLRLGATKSIRLRAAFGSSGGNAESMLPELLEASWSSVLIKELNAGVREDALAPFLDAMLLAQAQGSPETTCEAFFDRFKPKTSQGLCGYLFQRNDIAFNCRTCQLDETCVLCLKCYQNGNHEGHDVTFHRTLPGGMCDCGDAEAWDPDGFCIYHGNHDQEVDAVPLPPNVTQVADALFEEIVNFFVEMAKASIDSFDPDKVDRNGRIMLEQYRVLHEAEITNVCPLPSSPTQQRRLLSAWSPRFHVRICNDDVHSDEDLVSSLSKKHIREARRLVRSIDSNGSELIASNLKLRDALALMQQLKTEGWHVCVVHDQHIRDENILIRVIQWVKNICALSRPLHKMFCDKLFSTTNAVAAPKEPIQVMFLSDPYFRKEIVTVLYELYLKLQSDKDPKLQFSIVFLKVYNRLMVKYFCGIGTRDETLFGYGVQIFTTPSIVNRLAGLGLIEILLDTMTTSLDLAKTSTLTGAASLAAKSTLNSSPSSSLSVPTRTLDCEHSILKFKRFSFILDHLGYVMNIPAMTSEMFLNKDQLRKWYSSLRQMQGFDPQVRIQDGHAHVTYETGTWFTAFNFHSYISRLMTTLCKGLRQHEGTIEEKAAMVRNVMDGYWEQLEFGGITDPNIAMHSPSFGFGVGSPFSDTIVKYDVASQPVSFHYPLHGFLANFLLECMYYGPEISDWKLFIENSLRVLDDADAEAGHDDEETRRRRKKMLVYGMMEFPLRTLVLCAQIQSGLWIRNGQSMHRQMLHYANPPLCSELRDLDLLLVQISSCVLGFTKFLGIYFDRFGLMDWLHTWNTNGQDTYRESTFTMGDEKLVALLEGALLHMIWLVTELPPPMEDIKERDVWLRREIVHRLSQHPCRLSELLDQTGFMTSTPFGGVSSPQGNEHLARLESILEDIADVQVRSRIGQDEDGVDPGAMEPTKYVLKKEFYREYDPAFYHLARSAHEKAQFARQEALFKHWKVEDDPIPLVQHLPPVHSSLASVRLLVCEKGLLGILRLVLEDATSQSTPKKTNVMVILRTIHLLSLVVLVLRNENPKLGASLVDTKKRRVLGYLRSGPDAFEESEWTGSRGKKRYKRQNDESFDGDVQMSSDSDQGDLTEVQDLSIVSLLVTFAKDQVEHDFDTSKSTISAIYWILKELAALDATIHIFVQENVWKGMKKAEDHTADNGLSKAQLKKLHQQRAIEAMMAKQKAFAQSSMFAEMDEFDEDDEDDLGGDRVADGDDGVVSGSTIVYRPPPPPECIICTQKKKKEPVMYIGHAQTSQVNVHALQEKPFPAAPLSETFPPPLFLTLCGHAVHLQCWKKYFDSVKAQSRYNLEHSQSNIAFDAHFGEFLCPLCQSLSSMLVPHVPPSKTLTHDEQQRDRDAMERVFQAKQDTTSVLLWLTDGLPSRLIALEGESEFEDIEIDVDDDIGTGTADTDDDDEQDENHGTAGVRQEDDVRAMKQFAVSFLEALSRFQPDMTHMTATIANLKKSFISTGPQLTHLMWSAVTSTCTSVQLSGVSAAVFALEAANSPTETFLARRRLPRNSPPGRASSSSSPLGSGTGGTGSLASTSASSFSSLRITSILNPPLPSLKSRLAVGLPESLDASLDHFSPKDDGKLNCLLRSLRRVSLLFKNRKQDFYRTMVLPILRGLRLNLGAEEWMGSLSRGAPLQLGQPILSQDLFYLCVAVCSSMLHTKADILLTIRSMCVLHMAQVLLQIARMTAEEQDDYEDDSETTDRIDEDGNQQSKREPMTPREKETAHHLSILMERLSVGAGVDVLARAERDGAPYSPPRGSQLLYMFQSSSLAFMRQVTLLCRGFFRGEHDPDASNYANFVSSLRLSTNYNEMCQQLGLPSVEQVLADQSLMSYLDQAATQLRTSRLACIPDDVQFDYRQHGHVDGVLQAIDEQAVAVATAEGESESERISVILRNLNQLPALPIRCIEDASTTRQFYYANVRLVRLQPLYTDLHSEVLARSRCPTTDKLVENPAICLVCEQVLCAGTDCCRRQSDNMGACTAHAISCGYGVGLFFLMRSSSVLLVFGPRSSYFGSPYLDMFGEEDINLRRGRPLYLNSKRMKALLTLYANHQLANEVARNRRTSDQYIRNNYY